jgi:hypothetical protein
MNVAKWQHVDNNLPRRAMPEAFIIPGGIGEQAVALCGGLEQSLIINDKDVSTSFDMTEERK